MPICSKKYCRVDCFRLFIFNEFKRTFTRYCIYTIDYRCLYIYIFTIELLSLIKLECARTHHENKIIRRRNNLKINIESSPLIDSMPFTIRSATFPLVKSNDFPDNNNGNSNNSSISSNLSSNDINAIKRKESLPW